MPGGWLPGSYSNVFQFVAGGNLRSFRECFVEPSAGLVGCHIGLAIINISSRRVGNVE